MSASKKKKLRSEQEAAKMTERQLAEQKEAKQVKLYTTLFVVVLAALIVIAVSFGVTNAITNSGSREKNTVAMTVGGHEISNAELNYYFFDTLNSYNQSGYAAMLNLDMSKPLNEQACPLTADQTWADFILESAKDKVKEIYALNDAAAAAGFAASEDVSLSVESTVGNMSMYATLYGYPNVDTFLKAQYGKGADEAGYRDYVTKSLTADAYYNSYRDGLTYDDAALREAEKENFDAFSSFTYNYYTLSASRFLNGGTTAEDGTVTYSDEEKAAALAACEEAAKTLTAEEITSVELLDAAINALPVNAEGTDVSSFQNNRGYNSIPAAIAEWVSNDSRREGDLTYLENTTTDADGNKTVNGYYVVYFHSANDNAFPLKNVRHILVSFLGGTTDEYGNTTYSDEEKAVAKTEAEAILAEFQAGSANEESFAALATLKSTDPGSVETGGLYENVYPGQMVPAFENWCFDESRKAGDTGIVETEYGYHVMYFSGNSDVTYRDYQITESLRTTDLNTWYEGIRSAMEIVDGDYRYIPMDFASAQN